MCPWVLVPAVARHTLRKNVITYLVTSLPNWGFVTCFFMQLNLCGSWINVSKYLYGLSFDDSVSINTSEKRRQFRLQALWFILGNFIIWWRMLLERQEILISWKEAIMRITPCSSPHALLNLLTYRIQPSLSSLESPHHPSSLSLLVWQTSSVWNSRRRWFCPFYKI